MVSYNSVFFTSTSYNKYQIYFADAAFATGAPYDGDIFNITGEMRLQLMDGTTYQA